jgi:hypothetical protein
MWASTAREFIPRSFSARGAGATVGCVFSTDCRRQTIYNTVFDFAVGPAVS